MANRKGKLSPEEKARRKALRAENPPKIHMVTDNYRVVGRHDEFTPEEKKVNSVTGEETWKSLGHHTQLSSSIDSIAIHVTRDHMDDLLYVSQQLEEIKEIAKSLLKS
jgi:hypothetical protein